MFAEIVTELHRRHKARRLYEISDSMYGNAKSKDSLSSNYSS